MRTQARQEVEDAVEAMKKRGLIVNRPNVDQLREWNALAEAAYPLIRGSGWP